MSRRFAFILGLVVWVVSVIIYTLSFFLPTFAIQIESVIVDNPGWAAFLVCLGNGGGRRSLWPITAWLANAAYWISAIAVLRSKPLMGACASAIALLLGGTVLLHSLILIGYYAWLSAFACMLASSSFVLMSVSKDKATAEHRAERRLLLVLLLLLLVLDGLMFVPSVRWPVYGVFCGDAFYQGMPTSYWKRQLHQQPDSEIARARDEMVAGGADAVPVLIEVLQDPHFRNLRVSAALCLERIGPPAQAATPLLVKRLNDLDGLVAEKSADALKSIDPELAIKAGVK